MSSKKILKGDTTQDGGLDCLHLCPSKLVVGGCSDGGGWLATWRVLARNQCSRLIDGLVDDWLVGWSMVWFLVGCLSQI